MVNPENNRLIADEKGVLEAEAALARDEHKALQRLEASLSDALDKRTQALVTRIGALEQSPDANAADLQKARGIALAGSAPDPVVAQGERASALSARKGALQARELALKALTSALAAVESQRAARGKELDQAEQLLGLAESGAKKAADQKKRDADEAAKKAADAAKKAEDDRKAAARAAAAAEETSKTVPEMAPIAVPSAAKTEQYKVELKTEPGYRVEPAPVKTEPGVQPVKAAPAKTETGAHGKAAKAPEAPLAPGQKRVSRRRRVKLAPPPKKLEVEVAVYGPCTFYTGFDLAIGTGGLFVESLETLPQGYELDVEITLEGKKIASRARVDWVRQDNMANPECTSGAGLKLLNLSRDHASTIEGFFQRRTPIFYVTGA